MEEKLGEELKGVETGIEGWRGVEDVEEGVKRGRRLSNTPEKDVRGLDKNDDGRRVVGD